LPQREVSDIKRQVKKITLWLTAATAAVVFLQALIALLEMFVHH
jgi:hypothetical protein